MLEVVRLAEEIGQIGGERIDEGFEFALVAAHPRQVVGEALEPQRAQAARQANVDHVALGLRERDAGAFGHQRPDGGEILFGELELARQRFEAGLGEALDGAPHLGDAAQRRSGILFAVHGEAPPGLAVGAAGG